MTSIDAVNQKAAGGNCASVHQRQKRRKAYPQAKREDESVMGQWQEKARDLVDIMEEKFWSEGMIGAYLSRPGGAGSRFEEKVMGRLVFQDGWRTDAGGLCKKDENACAAYFLPDESETLTDL